MQSPNMTTSEINDVARGVVLGASEQKLVLGVPGTNYEIQLVPTASISTPVGKRIKGTIHAQALRMFKATGGGGGRFIEPISGEPRIVAGMVTAIDSTNRRVLVDVAVPMWMTLAKAQPADAFAEGDLVNCYVESGVRFTPVARV